jgi:transcriptional regulator GlxA family with amidase domain
MKVPLLTAALLAPVVAVAHADAQHTMTSHGQVRNVAVLLYPHAIMLDYAPPAEVFRAADSSLTFRVFTVGSSRAPIPAMFPKSLTPDYSTADAPAPEVVIIPGGMTDIAVADTAVANWLKGVHSRGAILMSVCTGAFVLADLGFLDSKQATTLHLELRTLREKAPRATVVSEPFVDAGDIVTVAGSANAIDASLHLLERLNGVNSARWVAHDYLDDVNWRPEKARSQKTSR